MKESNKTKAVKNNGFVGCSVKKNKTKAERKNG